MKQKKSKKTYNDDFKKTMVELYHSGSSMSSLSVSEVTIYKWIKALTPVGMEVESLTPLKYIAAIQKENLRLKQEVAILKMAIFQYIEGWYTRKRIHSKLNYQTPQEVEDRNKQSA